MGPGVSNKDLVYVRFVFRLKFYVKSFYKLLVSLLLLLASYLERFMR